MKSLKERLFILMIGLQLISCGNNDDNVVDTPKNKSITKAYFTKTFANFKDTYFIYDLGDVINNFGFQKFRLKDIIVITIMK